MIVYAFQIRRWPVAVIALCLGGCLEPAGNDGIILTGPTMGTSYTVRINTCTPADCDEIEQALIDRLTDLTQRLSHYEAGSELSGFNDHADTDWFPVSEDLVRVVDYAQIVSRLSNGAFDISVGPAVDAWGFGPPAVGRVPPDAETVRELRQHIDYQKFEVRMSPPALRKKDPRLRLDLSSLAKGYGVDQLTYLLESRGIRDYLVEIGGELRTAGVRADGKPWRIGIQPPTGDSAIEFVILPGDSAVATSGDYQNYYMIGDRRVSHTIDPKSGTPVESGLASVTVIAPDAMQADALATALMVMGPASAARFAEQHDIAVLLLTRSGREFRPVTSPAFKPYLLKTGQ